MKFLVRCFANVSWSMSCLYFYHKTNASFEDDCLLKLPACQVLHRFSLRFVTTWKLISTVFGESWALLTASRQLRAILPYADHSLMTEQPGHLCQNQRWYAPVIPGLRRLRQEDQKPEASLTQLIPESPFQPVSWCSGSVPALHQLAHCGL